MAGEVLSKWIKEENTKPNNKKYTITFIDFSKAYNSIPQDKLLDILSKKYDKETMEIIE